MKSVANNFFDEWAVYDQVLDHNYMHHDDIYRDVQSFLADRYENRPFSVLHLGCGNARHLAQAALDLLCAHIRGNDFPETTATLSAMAIRAGFGQPVELDRFRWHHTCCLNRDALGFRIT